MKKIIAICVAILLATGWGIRFYFVNKDVNKPIIQVFQKGTEVPVGKDFFDRSDEDMDGYTVTVLDAELMSLDDFLQKYKAEEHRTELGVFTDYIYTVRVSISNQDNKFTNEKGISLVSYVLQGTDYILSLEQMSYQYANPDMPGASFSLRQGTSMELLLPFEIMSSLTSYEHILSDPPKLQISQYPHQKMLRLN